MAAAAIAAVALEKTLKKLFPLYWKESYRQSSSAAAAAVLSKTSSQLHLVALTRSLSIFPALFPFCYQSFFCLFQGQSFFYLTFRVLFVQFCAFRDPSSPFVEFTDRLACFQCCLSRPSLGQFWEKICQGYDCIISIIITIVAFAIVGIAGIITVSAVSAAAAASSILHFCCCTFV